MSLKKPELLAPAGNLEKLKTAFLFGADAVYVGGHVFGLRKYAENFDLVQLEEGLSIANQQNKKVYLVLNGYPQETDLYHIQKHLEKLEKIKPHAYIVADIGLMHLIQSISQIPIHVSTQASITNSWACNYLKEQGAKRIIFARETSLDELKTIKEKTDLETEIFIHGAMCASYSGKCVISNYSAGRDSNRGGCVQSCRHQYQLKKDPSDHIEQNASIMNAQDLMGIDQIKKIIALGIDSLKIEGRMKSNLYLANVISQYRQAIDQTLSSKTKATLKQNLNRISNRTFSDTSLNGFQETQGINLNFAGYSSANTLIGIVQDIQNEIGIIETKNPFSTDDTLTLHSPNNQEKIIKITQIETLSNTPINKTKPNSLVKIKLPKGTKKLSLLSRKK